MFTAHVPASIDGRIVWTKKSTGITDPRTAKDCQAMLDQLGPDKARAWDILAHVTESRLSLAALFDLFRACGRDLAVMRAKLDDTDIEPLVATWDAENRKAARDIEEDTADHYLAAVRLLVPADAPFFRSTFTDTRCDEWIAEMDVAAGTIRKRAAGLNDFAKWLQRRKVIKANPMRDVALPSPGRPRDRWLTTEQVIALAETKAEPYRSLDLVLAATAADLTTALELTRGDVDLATMTVRLRGTKATKRDRSVAVAAFAHDAVRALCAGRMPHARMFAIPNRYNASDYHRDTLARIAETHPWAVGYWLRDHRHTWAVRMAQTGAPFALIAAGLGHANEVLVAKVYGRYVPDASQRAAWEKKAARADRKAAR